MKQSTQTRSLVGILWNIVDKIFEIILFVVGVYDQFDEQDEMCELLKMIVLGVNISILKHKYLFHMSQE